MKKYSGQWRTGYCDALFYRKCNSLSWAYFDGYMKGVSAREKLGIKPL